MILDQNYALREHICVVLDSRNFVLDHKANSLVWSSGDYRCSLDGLRVITGWTVTLIRSAFSPALHIAFADNIEPLFQDRLKALIGHCIVEKVALITPWKVLCETD